ncbi:Hypothetical protein NTJ_01234 [Nesidiocoris tenuis]|uniref:Uncharacterized protein n=1 Tax=Nesidiocoris tenuis TaxID=355587 RepID=A0ABN7A8X4_9HEMI|nr:Hypothetical protein NTJ_01234 [Nesidiocoris tenuis]
MTLLNSHTHSKLQFILGDGVSTYQNEGGGPQGKNQEEYQGDQSQYQQGDQTQSQQGDQSQYQQGDQGPDKYLGDKTQYPVEPEPYEDDGKKEILNTAGQPQQEEQFQGKEAEQATYQGDQAGYDQGYDPAQYPEGYDPNQYAEGYDPNQYPEGYDPNQYPEGYDPNQYPEGYDPSQYPEGYDPSQYPEGYDPSQYQAEYAEGYPDETGQTQAMPTNVQPAPAETQQPVPPPPKAQQDLPVKAPAT